MTEKTYQPSEAELDILRVVWNREPVAVKTVHEEIAAIKDVGYTTVLKQMQRMMEKGVLTRTIENGVHLYSAVVGAGEVKQELASKMLRAAFGGSALEMVMHAVNKEKTSQEELEKIKQWLDSQLNNQ